MMRFRKKSYALLILFYISGFYQHAAGQTLPISGDTIYVTARSEVQIDFPSIPKGFTSTPNIPYRFKQVGRGINIIAGPDNTPPAVLLVEEAQRYHRFVIVFKKNISKGRGLEVYYDYSTEEKLEQHIKGAAARDLAISPITTADSSVSARPSASAGYAALMEKGDKEMKEQNYQEAKASFDKAHLLGPDEAAPIQRLEALKLKLAANEKSFALTTANNNSYSLIIAGAINYMGQQKYGEAQNLYKQALTLRPGDLYATRQMEIIDKMLLETNNQKASGNLYNDFIAQGEKALGKNQLKEARAAYEQALSARQEDEVATRALKLISDRENLLKQTEALENNYKSALQSGDKFYEAADFTNAKTAYNKAISFIKKPYPQDQLKKIDQLLNEQASKEAIEKERIALQLAADKVKKEKTLLEQNYTDALQVADNYFKKGDFANAKKAYNSAAGVINRPYPQDQVKKIENNN
ncbi:MAG: hypothetical protein WKI04_05625 [Ferruginibacter sp.]